MAELELQSLWFDANQFSESQAVAWAQSNNFKSETVRFREDDGLITHFILPQFDTSEAVDGSWKTASDTFPEGVSASLCQRRQAMNDKCFSTFEIKAFDEEERVIRGIASTPEPDREGDVVMPKGATFSVPFPLLAQHDHSQPVGMVTRAEVADDGIFIEASIAKDTGLSYVERTWRQVKAGLLRGLSIGFRATKSKASATGRVFEAFEILELSLVSIPANAGAGIAQVKQYDGEIVEVDEEQLLELEARTTDVKDRAAAAIAKANQTLNQKDD